MIAVIEEAIKARIAEAALPYKPAIATYGGEFDEGLDQVVRRFPAVWVVFAHDGPGKAISTSKEIWHIPATFVVLVGARNLRSEASTRQGDGRQVGTYRMLADVRRLLTGQDLGLPIDPFVPGRARTIVNASLKGQAVSAFALEWHTIYPLRLRELETPEPPLLERVGLNYHLVPDDGVADAADLVTLKPKGEQP